MFGYIKKSEVLKINKKGQNQLREKENCIILTVKKPETEFEVRDFLESINKLEGGIYYLECLKKHFK